MNDIKLILYLLEKHNIHVNELDDIITSVNPFNTHYLMKGDEIIHKGNLKTIESFVLNLEKKND